MDYEKKYKEALERAKEQLNGAKVFDYDNEQIAHNIRSTVYNIFPQIKGTEDERIRKVKMEKYFCMECKHFGYDVLGRGACYKDEDNPCSVGAYQVHTETECFRKKLKGE